MKSKFGSISSRFRKSFHRLPQDKVSAQPALEISQPKSQDTAWNGLDRCLRLLIKIGGNSLGPLSAASDDIVKCIEVFETVSKNQQGYRKLWDELSTLFNQICDYFGQDTPLVMTPSIINIARGIEREILFAVNKQRQTRLERLTGATKDADDILDCQNRVWALLKRLELNANLSMWKTVDEIATEARLKGLPIAPEAKHRSAASVGLGRTGCAPNTRTQILEGLHDWANTQSGERIYWLNGMAGTGKTAIAYSFCEDLRKQHTLAASFYCSRQLPSCRNINKILPTISFQLALFSRPLRYALSGALEDLDVHNQPLSEQFECLIANPLHAIRDTLPDNLVVVIDALDECDSADGVKIVLDVLLSHAQHLPLKFFVSTWPDANILDRMRSPAGEYASIELRLHELERSVVQDDIKQYLTGELQPNLTISEADLEILTARSGVLFIYAATVVRYIMGDDTSRSPRRLQDILQSYQGRGLTTNDKEIDVLYTTILEVAMNNPRLNDMERDEMRLVLYSIICAQEPLSIDTIARLLKLDPGISVRPVLRAFLSVLQLSDKTGKVSTLHQSLTDYMFNQRRSGLFFCDTQAHHTLMGQLCFDQISATSRFNVCNLESSLLLDDEVEDIETRVQSAISEELYYACHYWAAHLKSASDSDQLAASLFRFLSERVLLWMEIMNLKKCLYDGARVIYEAREWHYVSTYFDYTGLLTAAMQMAKQTKATHQLLSDTWEFVSSFCSHCVDLSTPHIYVSYLSFWPRGTPIAKCYQAPQPGLISEASTALSVQSTAPVAIFDTRGEINCMRYSHSGCTIVSSSRDSNSIYIWDARNGKRIGQPLEGHTNAVTSVAYSTDDALIISGSVDCTVRVWDAHTGKSIGQPLEGHTKYILTVACSPDGAHIASGSKDKTIRIWDAGTRKALRDPLQYHASGVMSVVYSPDGRSLASCSDDKSVCIWDVHTGYTLSQVLQGHTDCVYSISYSPDGAYIASGSGDRTIRIWDLRTGETARQLQRGHMLPITTIAYSLDGVHIISGSLDQKVRIWDAHTGQVVGKPLEGHTQWASSIAPSPNGAYISSGSNDGTIRIWPMHNNDLAIQPPEGHTDAVLSVAYSPDGTRIVSGSADKTVRIWDPHTGQMVGRSPESHARTVYSAIYSPDGARIVSAYWDGTLCVWDACTGEVVGSPLEGHTSSVTSIAYSSDGEFLVSGSSDKTVRIWDAHSCKAVVQPLEGHVRPVRSVAYSPNGAFVASGSDDFTIRIWDARTGKAVGRPLQGHTDKVTSVVYSPNGLYIVSGSEDESIRIWDAYHGKPIGQPLQGHMGPVMSVAYSPCGAYIASGSEDMTVRIWDSRTGKLVGNPLEHTSWVLSVAYSPDGAHIVTGSYGGTIRVWLSQLELVTDVPVQSQADFVSAPESNCSPRDADPKSHICNSGCQLDGLHERWNLNTNGWVVTRDNKRLAWIPHELREALLCPRSTACVSKRGFLKLDFNSDGVSKVGENWTGYFRPRT